MTGLGLAITFLTATALFIEFFRHREAKLAAYGWAALIGLIIAEWLLFRGVQPIAVYFTPIAWTCCILLADAAVLAIRGPSRLHDEPRKFASAAVLSIPLWLIFEAYNLRLQNWSYSGVPVAWPLALLGYGWSFATIFPGIFETADLIESFVWFPPRAPIRFPPAVRWTMGFPGPVCILAPLIAPPRVASR